MYILVSEKLDNFQLFRMQQSLINLRQKNLVQNITLQKEISIFTNPSAWAGYDTRSIFKRSLTGLNSEFSFS